MANTYPIVIRELPSNNPVDYRFAKMLTAANNGVIVTIPNKETTRDVYVATLADKDTDGIDSAELWIVTGVELSYEAGKMTGDYVNAANKPFRIERIAAGGIYAVSLDGLGIADGQTVASGDAVCVGDNGVMDIIAAASVINERVVGWVVNLFERGGIDFAAIRFIPASGSGSGGGSSFEPVIPMYTYNSTTQSMDCNMTLADICDAVASGACTFAFVVLNGQEQPHYFKVDQFMPPSSVLFSNLAVEPLSGTAVYTMLMHDSSTGIQTGTANWTTT